MDRRNIQTSSIKSQETLLIKSISETKQLSAMLPWVWVQVKDARIKKIELNYFDGVFKNEHAVITNAQIKWLESTIAVVSTVCWWKCAPSTHRRPSAVLYATEFKEGKASWHFTHFSSYWCVIAPYSVVKKDRRRSDQLEWDQRAHAKLTRRNSGSSISRNSWCYTNPLFMPPCRASSEVYCNLAISTKFFSKVFWFVRAVADWAHNFLSIPTSDAHQYWEDNQWSERRFRCYSAKNYNKGPFQLLGSYR